MRGIQVARGQPPAYADEYAVERVNRAVGLLGELSPADAVRALQSESVLCGAPGASVRERCSESTRGRRGAAAHGRVRRFRLAPSLIAGLRGGARSRGLTLSAALADAVRCYLDQAHERHGGKAR